MEGKEYTNAPKRQKYDVIQLMKTSIRGAGKSQEKKAKRTE